MEGNYMTDKLNELSRSMSSVTWFVGAVIKGKDRMQEFIDKGIWINGYENKYTDHVNSIKIGDKIAIKSSYTRKHNLPFDNKGKMVSVMGIKAVGVVTHNFNDGHKISVKWNLLDDVKEWYFFTSRQTIWKVDEEDGWMYKNLIEFTFNNAKQNIERFISDPYWQEKYGDNSEDQFEWAEFYEVAAKALLKYKGNRSELLNRIHKIYDKINMKNPLIEKLGNGSKEFLTDICPFTVFGLFNRGITDTNRILIIEEIADILELEEDIPASFDGIPILNNMKTWFFANRDKREEDDIDNLWKLFESAIYLAEDYTDENKNSFINIYDRVINQLGIQWNITLGLYWIKPWDYLTLDSNTKIALTDKLKIQVPKNSKKKMCTGKDYISLIELLKDKFNEEDYPVHSFPELSYKACSGEIEDINTPGPIIENGTKDDYGRYTKDKFLSEVFISDEDYETIKSLLTRKKNIILQGAPGVGKTFASKRLAYAIIGEKNENRIEFIQFHQNYSYEDFIMGYKPDGDNFKLKYGIFYNFCKRAENNPNKPFFFIIDEINRGNMSKIFGELLMLIEKDYRNKKATLAYNGMSFSVPKNLHIIGMMNTADRSLAMIDYALRRRFSFYEMEPGFDSDGFKVYQRKLNDKIFDDLIEKIKDLNKEIISDSSLGKGFVIGHSYFCEGEYADSKWLNQVVEYDILPMLSEYWFDEPAKLQKWENILYGVFDD